jgi:hypothetical protein
LLEDKHNADFHEGAALNFGEVLRRADPDRTRWEYERRYHPDPHLAGRLTTRAAEHLVTVYSKTGGVLQGWCESCLIRKQRHAG